MVSGRWKGDIYWASTKILEELRPRNSQQYLSWVSAKIIISTTILFFAVESYGQDTIKYKTVFPSGISVGYGQGLFSVKDEYISKEKYSGTLSYYSFGWARGHNKYVYRLNMAYRYSNDICNYNVSTGIHQLRLNQGFLYPLKKIILFKNDLYIWLGPSTELFFYYSKPNIAFSGFDYAQSFAVLAAIGFNADVIYPVNNNFQLESSLSLTAISMGFHLVDTEEDDQSPVKLLTLFSGLNSSFAWGIRYYLFNRLSVKLAYKFELTRISAWDPLLSASDNLVIGLTYKF